jgi:hypothetical protein
MKKIAMMLIAIALAAALGTCALAAGWTEFVNKNGAKVYADYNTDSKVIATLNKGDKVTVTDIVDMRGKWKAVTIKVRGKKKAIQTTVDTMEKHAIGGRDYADKCFICHSNCPDTAEQTRDAVSERFPNIRGDIRI